jgi:predicted DNA-binding transcriptional regulator AlpA
VSPPPDPADRFVGARELASLYSVCERTIYNWELRGVIPPALRIGKARRWRLAEVRARLLEGGQAHAS